MNSKVFVLLPALLLGPINVTFGSDVGTGLRAATSSTQDAAKPLAVHVATPLGKGRALLVVKWLGEDDVITPPLRVSGTERTFLEVAPDGREKRIRVEASFPRATRLTIGGEEIFAIFRKGHPVYLRTDMCVGWSLLSDSTPPTVGRTPNVVCRGIDDACPAEFVISGDPPFHRDARCPDPRSASSSTAKICYRPGRLRFQSTVGKTIKLVDRLTLGSERIELAPGVPSDPKPFEYERCRPQAVEIDGRIYYFAVGVGEQWLVTITDEGVAARVQ